MEIIESKQILMKLMKVIVHKKFGSPDVLQFKDVEKPTSKDNEVLVRVYATTATLYDCWVRSSKAPPGFWFFSRIASGIRKPKQLILGTELAGEIDAVGADVDRFMVGDQVFGFSENLGAYTEYICLPEGSVGIKQVIDRRYPLEQAAQAHKYVETGQKKGYVVITLEHNNKT